METKQPSYYTGENEFWAGGKPMQEWINQMIEGLAMFAGLQGFSILLLTVPLSIVQGIFSLFPFVSLILVHISTFGYVSAIVISWLLGSLSSMVAFVVFRYMFFEWFQRRFAGKLTKYEKWQNYMDNHGGWVVILLRSVPIIPNNVISFMAAVSPIRIKHYCWSTVIGTLSNVWLLGLLLSTFESYDKSIVAAAWIAYAAFCAAMFIIYLAIMKRNARQRD